MRGITAAPRRRARAIISPVTWTAQVPSAPGPSSSVPPVVADCVQLTMRRPCPTSQGLTARHVSGKPSSELLQLDDGVTALSEEQIGLLRDHVGRLSTSELQSANTVDLLRVDDCNPGAKVSASVVRKLPRDLAMKALEEHPYLTPAVFMQIARQEGSFSRALQALDIAKRIPQAKLSLLARIRAIGEPWRCQTCQLVNSGDSPECSRCGAGCLVSEKTVCSMCGDRGVSSPTLPCSVCGTFSHSHRHARDRDWCHFRGFDSSSQSTALLVSCPFCETPNPSGVSECVRCTYPLTSGLGLAVPFSKLACTSCAAQNAPWRHTCWHCGDALPAWQGLSVVSTVQRCDVCSAPRAAASADRCVNCGAVSVDEDLMEDRWRCAQPGCWMLNNGGVVCLGCHSARLETVEVDQVSRIRDLVRLGSLLASDHTEPLPLLDGIELVIGDLRGCKPGSQRLPWCGEGDHFARDTEGNLKGAFVAFRQVFLQVVDAAVKHRGTAVGTQAQRTALEMVRLSNESTDADELGFQPLQRLALCFQGSRAVTSSEDLRIAYLTQMKLEPRDIVEGCSSA